jgi:hypothetical protein
MNPIAGFLTLVCFGAGAAAVALWNQNYLGAACVAVGVIIAQSLKMANVWQKFVILRMAMNIIYETTKERGATILMPTSMVDSLNPSAAILASSLALNGINRSDPNPPATAPSG